MQIAAGVGGVCDGYRYEGGDKDAGNDNACVPMKVTMTSTFEVDRTTKQALRKSGSHYRVDRSRLLQRLRHFAHGSWLEQKAEEEREEDSILFHVAHYLKSFRQVFGMSWFSAGMAVVCHHNITLNHPLHFKLYLLNSN